MLNNEKKTVSVIYLLLCPRFSEKLFEKSYHLNNRDDMMILYITDIFVT